MKSLPYISDFVQGPIRPPNEAKSLLLRISRNCPWNRCLFCPVYKDSKFSLRSVKEIKADIEAARDITDNIINFSMKNGTGRIDKTVISHIVNQFGHHSSYYSVAAKALKVSSKAII